MKEVYTVPLVVLTKMATVKMEVKEEAEIKTEIATIMAVIVSAVTETMRIPLRRARDVGPNKRIENGFRMVHISRGKNLPSIDEIMAYLFRLFLLSHFIK